jgi:stage II sporulation protein D
MGPQKRRVREQHVRRFIAAHGRPIHYYLAFAFAALMVLLAVPPAANAASQAWQMTLTGRGYGHGIGMSQYGAYGYALHGFSYRAILLHYYTGISFGAITDRDVRVLLTDAQGSVSVTCPAAYQALVGSQTIPLAAGSTSKVSWTGSAFRLTSGSETWTSSQAIVFQPTSRPLVLVNRSGILNAANAPYRGSLRVAHQTSGLYAINSLPVESYLRGVVSLEMSSSWPLEALKAQAVAARTYAVRSIGGGLFDLYCDTRSQSYGGASRETATTNAAVSGTAGVIATYAGQPIAAFYFSTSGGHTENIENIWETAPQPYLKGVDDPYDTLSPYHIWPDPIVKSASSVAATLGAGNLPPGQLQALYVTKRGVSSRVSQALAISDEGATRLPGSTIRTALGLRDTWFSVRAMSVSPGSRTSLATGQRLTLTGRTYPALPSGTAVTLFFYRNGRWSSAAVPSGSISNSTRRLTANGITNSCSFTSYRYTINPPATTKYYFAAGSSQSPQMTVTVDGTPAPSPSPTVAPSPGPTASPAPVAKLKYRTEATRRFTLRRGAQAVLRYRVVCPAAKASTRASVVIRIRRLDGRSVKTIVLSKRQLNVVQTTEFPCRLVRGTYRYYVYATFAGSGAQTKVGTNRITVR